MKMYLLSDNVDTLRGMRLAGIEGVVVHTHDEVSKALEHAVQDKSIGVLLVTDKLSTQFPELFKDIKLSRKTPLIIGIPDRHSKDRAVAISEYIRESIGIKI